MYSGICTKELSLHTFLYSNRIYMAAIVTTASFYKAVSDSSLTMRRKKHHQKNIWQQWNVFCQGSAAYIHHLSIKRDVYVNIKKYTYVAHLCFETQMHHVMILSYSSLISSLPAI